MSVAQLSEGKSLCVVEAQVTIELSRICFAPEPDQTTHLATDVYRGIFTQVHRVNRTGGGGRIAIDLPGFDPAKIGIERLGKTIRVSGPKNLLATLLAERSLRNWAKNGVVQCLEENTAPILTHGLKRNRQGEKSTAAGILRAKKRAEKRGHVWEKRDHSGNGIPKPGHGLGFLGLDGHKKLAFTRIEVDSWCEVSTYGLM